MSEQTPKTEAQKSHQDPKQKDIEENKAIAVLSYIGILFVVPLLIRKESEFAVYHAKQGLVLFIISTISGMVMGLFGAVAIIPILGLIIFLLVFLVWGVVMLGVFVLMIMGIINVLQGKMKPLPLIGELANKFNI